MDGRAVVSLRPDDGFLRAVAQLTGASGVAVSLPGHDGAWCTAAVGDVAAAWGALDRWRPPSCAVPIRSTDGKAAGSLLVFGGEPDPAVLASLRTLATRLGTCPGVADAPAPAARLVVIDPLGRLRAVSPAVAELLGHPHDAAPGLAIFSVIHESDHAATIDSLTRMSTVSGERYPTDVRFLRRDGTTCVLEVLALDPTDDSATDLVFLVRETDEREDDDALVGAQARLLAMIGRGAPVPEILAEAAAFLGRRTGFAAAMLLADDAGALHLLPGTPIAPILAAAVDGERIVDATTTCGLAARRASATGCPDVAADPGWRLRPGGHAIDLVGTRSCWATPIAPEPGGTVHGVLALFGGTGRAVTASEVRLADLVCGLAAVAIERARVEAGLVRQAMHDPLTGLPNRALFLDRLTRALAPRPDRRRHTAVMFLDLDRFKVVNDALGHEAGDELLVAVADRLRGALRPAETIARFGGDEFTVLCEQLDSARDALVLAERLVAALTAPLPLGAGEVTVSASIGVAVADDVTDPSALLRDADAAMYRAKERGRNRVELFDRSMRELALARLELERSFRGSLERGDFALVLQPEYCLRTGAVRGAEALLRWHHPTRGLVSPTDFIPVAEETGAILPLGDWVLEEACRAALAHRDHPRVDPSFAVWVNVSVVQLLQPDFAARVEAIVALTGVDPSRIGLEITESAFLTDRTRSIDALTRLRRAGLRVAIDDFGTGYSSLAYLRMLPVDVVKLDRSFVADVADDPRARSVVDGVVHLARAVGCTTVAEGIETPQQLATLTEVGCDLGQGFWLARPAPPDERFPAAPIGVVTVGQPTSSSSSPR